MKIKNDLNETMGLNIKAWREIKGVKQRMVCDKNWPL